MTPSDPSPIPPFYPKGSVSYTIWRGLECAARGTLLVHGAKSLHYLKGCGSSTDPKDVISKMVESGVLIPCKVDLSCADPLTLQFKNLKYIQNSPWCTDHALFWTYSPGNPVPMKEYFP